MSWFFASDGQSVGVSVSASVLPKNIQDWFPLDLKNCEDTKYQILWNLKKKSVALAMYIGKQDSLKVSELYV